MSCRVKFIANKCIYYVVIVESGQTVSLPFTNPTRYGLPQWEFKEWVYQPTGSNELISFTNEVVINADTSVYAKWEHYEDTTQTCSTCRGSGRVPHTCTTCGGDGEVNAPCPNTNCNNGHDIRYTCGTCNGDMKVNGVDCPACDGTGNADCMTCTGRGYLSTLIDCSRCSGTGTSIDTCTTCGGDGEIDILIEEYINEENVVKLPYQEEQLKNIADAIRNKNGLSNNISATSFASEINALGTGVIGTLNQITPLCIPYYLNNGEYIPINQSSIDEETSLPVFSIGNRTDAYILIFVPSSWVSNGLTYDGINAEVLNTKEALIEIGNKNIISNITNISNYNDYILRGYSSTIISYYITNNGNNDLTSDTVKVNIQFTTTSTNSTINATYDISTSSIITTQVER